eukprot:gnl/Spiro4/9755_TR5179_c0_g1_i1.p1 gnl/Spiro4/9755_TR5179_c0_g1~~gnl/Spiro4/9755_TR5179_c0_g1_i1.p1  ORF type:complete len:107 (-),score=25.20 gnl/Spiro4/9755_TR5179_c0_g1_i1:118-408(-)
MAVARILAEIEVYTISGCPYCTRVKSLFSSKSAPFKEILIARDDHAGMAAVAAKSNGRDTFPQVFINGQHIGGCDDTYALNERGGLDPLLARAPSH